MRRVDLDRQIAARLPQLSDCIRDMEDPPQHLARFELTFGRTGQLLETRLAASTFKSCGVTDCAKAKLKGLRAQVIPGQDKYGQSYTFVFARGLPVQRAGMRADGQEQWVELPEDETTCHDELPPVSGRLPARVIQSAIRDEYRGLRRCYEAALKRDPEIRGRVAPKFVINREGKVASISLIDNTLPDCSAVRCMVELFTTITFPRPVNGEVTVVYPIMFQPT